MSGALGATAAGIATQIWGNAFISGAESFINQGIENGFGNVNYLDVLFSGIMGGFFARKNGISNGNFSALVTQKNKAVKRVTKAMSKFGRDGVLSEAKAAAKYYISQTWSLYYKNTLSLKNIWWDGMFIPIVINMGWHYSQRLVGRL